MTGRGWWVAIAGITAAALMLRTAGLRDRGVVDYDTATLLLEAKYIVDRGGEARPGMAHPAHTALLVVASKIFGWSEVTGLGVAALCGAATIPLVAGISLGTCGRASALLAALALAVSPAHVRASRSGGSDPVATVFLTAGVWAALAAWRRGESRPWWGAAGFLTGLAVAAHYRFLGPAAVLAGVAAWAGWRRSRRPAEAVGTLAWFTAGGVLVWGGVEAWYAWLRATGPGPHSYLSQLAWRIPEYRGRFTLEAPWAQAGYLWRLEGPGQVALGALGLVFCARDLLSREWRAGIPLAWALGPLVFWGLYSAGGLYPRNLIMALPGVAMLAGLGGAWLMRATGLQPVIAGLLVAALLGGFAVPRAWTYAGMTGGYAEAARALARDVVERGAPARLHWVYGPVWRLHLAPVAMEMRRPLESLVEVVRTTAPVTFWNYAIVDPMVYLMDPETRDRLDGIIASRRPFGRWPNTWAVDPLLIFDMGNEARRRALARPIPDLSRLGVYRLPARGR